MKKAYVKPQVLFENFELSANIAAGCGFPLRHEMTGCQPIPGTVLFLDKTSGCEYLPEENGLCYQTSTDTTRIFTS